MTRILIVDDDPDLRRLIDMRMRLSAIEAISVKDGQAALDFLSREEVDAVVLDVMLPGISGLETCRRIREELRLFDLPVIMLTARARPADVEEGMAVGATDYIIKPFSPRELLMRLQSRMGSAA
jgi:two-component system, OmpR family, phosphate regulon response regulator PhoB